MPRLIAVIGLAATLLILVQAVQAEPSKHPLAGVAIATPPPPPAGTVDLPRYPSISPDGKWICFSWRGDLWRASVKGGQAQRLTVHPGLDDISTWSPDGKQIAFNSTRSGYRNVYRMNADGSQVQAVTREDRSQHLYAWQVGDRLSVSSFREADVHRSPRPYNVAAQGGPIERLHDAFGHSATLSPDGKRLVFVRGHVSWDRPFATTPGTRELWLYDTQEETFKQLTTNLGHDGKPRWLNNTTLLYLSARTPDRVNLYKLDLETGESKASALTHFKDDDVRHFDLAKTGRTAVLQVWDKLYTLDLTRPDAKPIALSITAPTDAGDTTLVMPLAKKAKQAALSPDGKVMAIIAQGELFLRTLDSKEPPQRITRQIAQDRSPVWSPDGKALFFVSDRSGSLGIYKAKVVLTRSDLREAVEPVPIESEPEAPNDNDADQGGGEESTHEADADSPDRWHDAVRFAVEPVLDTPAHESSPSPSPDGKTLAFKRGNGDVVLLNLETREERVFHEGWDTSTHWAWSSDSKTLALCYEDQDHNADIWLGPADGSWQPINITKHPGRDLMPSFSNDGRILSFVSNRNDNQYDVYVVYLDTALETYTPQELADYYEKAMKAAKKLKPLTTSPAKDESKEDKEAEEHETDTEGKAEETEEPEEKQEEEKPKADAEPPFVLMPEDLSDTYRRLRRLTRTNDSEWDAIIHPGGEQVVFTRNQTLYQVGWDGDDEKKIAENIDTQYLDLTGSSLVAVQGGTAVTVELPGGSTNKAELVGSIRIDRQAHQQQRFVECARAVTQNFYDGTFKGIDWPAATAKYASLASRAWTADAFDDVADQYMGLLNASHLSIRSPSPDATNSQPNGRLGARYETVEQGYRVVAIEPDSPAAKGPMRLQVDDIVTAIDFEPLQPADTIAACLAGKVGRETAVSVLRKAEDADEPVELHLLLTPIDYRAYQRIRYDNWQAERRRLVDKWSDGRLGYIHIASMNQASLAEFERDLYAACEGRKGLLIDVRDNGGGWTTDRLLASIMTRRHAYTVPRGADPDRTNSYPNNRLFITRYNLPINALCNENSFSNAEIFSHAFKTLGRGTLVGNTTAGGVISTGRTTLLDGTSIRLPFRGWYLPDGTDMENNGAIPDLLVPHTPEDESKSNDAQLKAATEDLLKRIGD